MSVRLLPPTAEAWKGGEEGGRDIVVLMSGGVDSSVTAMLLKRAGWNVLGITMKIPVAEKCDYQRSCCGVEAAYVCRDLGIPHYYVDVREAFERLVIEPFRRSYAEGRTPSPCVDCNTVLKFGVVWDFVEDSFGVHYLATGHYARVVRSDGRFCLATAIDASRDQSYFLYGIRARRLSRLVLPLGELAKDEVRKLARGAGLPVARRPDSMELCFAGEGDYRDALAGVGGESGPILDTAGNVIGEHSGIHNYTVGQRRGMGVAAGKPLYVTRISPKDSSITAGTHAEACRRDVEVEDVNVLIPKKLRVGEELWGKIRSQGGPAECSVADVGGSTVNVRFRKPQFAPASGQKLVLYDGERVVAGGTMC